MTDRVSLVLALFILGMVGLDLFVLQSGATHFLVVKLVDLVEYLSFWR